MTGLRYAVGGPYGDGMRCCVCEGRLLWRGRPFRPEFALRLLRPSKLLSEVAYDHAQDCAAAVIATQLLITMDRKQALREAMRIAGTEPGTEPPER